MSRKGGKNRSSFQNSVNYAKKAILQKKNEKFRKELVGLKTQNIDSTYLANRADQNERNSVSNTKSFAWYARKENLKTKKMKKKNDAWPFLLYNLRTGDFELMLDKTERTAIKFHTSDVLSDKDYNKKKFELHIVIKNIIDKIPKKKRKKELKNYQKKISTGKIKELTTVISTNNGCLNVGYNSKSELVISENDYKLIQSGKEIRIKYNKKKSKKGKMNEEINLLKEKVALYETLKERYLFDEFNKEDLMYIYQIILADMESDLLDLINLYLNKSYSPTTKIGIFYNKIIEVDTQIHIYKNSEDKIISLIDKIKEKKDILRDLENTTTSDLSELRIQLNDLIKTKDDYIENLKNLDIKLMEYFFIFNDEITSEEIHKLNLDIDFSNITKLENSSDNIRFFANEIRDKIRKMKEKCLNYCEYSSVEFVQKFFINNNVFFEFILYYYQIFHFIIGDKYKNSINELSKIKKSIIDNNRWLDVRLDGILSPHHKISWWGLRIVANDFQKNLIQVIKKCNNRESLPLTCIVSAVTGGGKSYLLRRYREFLDKDFVVWLIVTTDSLGLRAGAEQRVDNPNELTPILIDSIVYPAKEAEGYNWECLKQTFSNKKCFVGTPEKFYEFAAFLPKPYIIFEDEAHIPNSALTKLIMMYPDVHQCALSATISLDDKIKNYLKGIRPCIEKNKIEIVEYKKRHIGLQKTILYFNPETKCCEEKVLSPIMLLIDNILKLGKEKYNEMLGSLNASQNNLNELFDFLREINIGESNLFQFIQDENCNYNNGEKDIDLNIEKYFNDRFITSKDDIEILYHSFIGFLYFNEYEIKSDVIKKLESKYKLKETINMKKTRYYGQIHVKYLLEWVSNNNLPAIFFLKDLTWIKNQWVSYLSSLQDKENEENDNDEEELTKAERRKAKKIRDRKDFQKKEALNFDSNSKIYKKVSNIQFGSNPPSLEELQCLVSQCEKEGNGKNGIPKGIENYIISAMIYGVCFYDEDIPIPSLLHQMEIWIIQGRFGVIFSTFGLSYGFDAPIKTSIVCNEVDESVANQAMGRAGRPGREVQGKGVFFGFSIPSILKCFKGIPSWRPKFKHSILNLAQYELNKKLNFKKFDAKKLFNIPVDEYEKISTKTNFNFELYCENHFNFYDWVSKNLYSDILNPKFIKDSVEKDRKRKALMIESRKEDYDILENDKKLMSDEFPDYELHYLKFIVSLVDLDDKVGIVFPYVFSLLTVLIDPLKSKNDHHIMIGLFLIFRLFNCRELKNPFETDNEKRLSYNENVMFKIMGNESHFIKNYSKFKSSVLCEDRLFKKISKDGISIKIKDMKSYCKKIKRGFETEIWNDIKSTLHRDEIEKISIEDFRNWFLTNSVVVLKMKKLIIDKMIKKRDKDSNINIFNLKNRDEKMILTIMEVGKNYSIENFNDLSSRKNKDDFSDEEEAKLYKYMELYNLVERFKSIKEEEKEHKSLIDTLFYLGLIPWYMLDTAFCDNTCLRFISKQDPDGILNFKTDLIREDSNIINRLNNDLQKFYKITKSINHFTFYTEKIYSSISKMMSKILARFKYTRRDSSLFTNVKNERDSHENFVDKFNKNEKDSKEKNVEKFNEEENLNDVIESIDSYSKNSDKFLHCVSNIKMGDDNNNEEEIFQKAIKEAKIETSDPIPIGPGEWQNDGIKVRKGKKFKK